jgi:hypothetical protein
MQDGLAFSWNILAAINMGPSFDTFDSREELNILTSVKFRSAKCSGIFFQVHRVYFVAHRHGLQNNET